MTYYARGRRAEWKTQTVLEQAGYDTIRASSSKGIVDVVAVGVHGIRLVSVKSGEAKPTPAERERLRFLAEDVRGRATVEIWRWPLGAREALRETL